MIKIINRPNWLASENCIKLDPVTVPQAMGELENGRMVVKSGTMFPSNDGDAIGIIYQDTDVTEGNGYTALMTAGYYYGAKLHEVADAGAITALNLRGLKNEVEPAVVRPIFGSPTKPKLDLTASITWDADTLTWEAVADAEGYRLYIDGVEEDYYDNTVLTFDTTAMPRGTYKFSVVAIGDNIHYVNSDAKYAIIILD